MARDNIQKSTSAVKLIAFVIFLIALYFTINTKPKIPPEKAERTEQVTYRTYGGYEAERAWGLLDAGDGLVVYGDTASFGAGGNDMYFIKTDYDGELQYTRTFGGTANESLIKAIKVKGGYLLAGGTESFGEGGTDGYIVKINDEGDKQWEITRGGENYDYFYGACETHDGYLFCGYSSSFGSGGNSDAYAVKTDFKGKLQWYKTYGGEKWDIFYSVQPLPDGFAFLGYTDSYGNGQTDIYLVKTDKEGNTIWARTYGGTRQDMGSSLIRSGDGGFVILGKSASYISKGFGWDGIILKTDADGNSMWSKVLPTSEFDPSCVFFEREKHIYAAGLKKCYGMCDAETYLIRADPSGNTETERFYSAIKDDMASGIIYADKGFYISGTTLSYGKGMGDIFLVKTGLNFNKVW